MKHTERKDGKRIALGTAVALVVYLGLLALSALLLAQGRVGESHAALCVTVSAALAACAGAKTASWDAAKPIVPAAICIGAAFCAVVLLGFLTYDTLDVRRVLCLAASFAVGGVCSQLVHMKKRGKKRPRRLRK